MMYTSLMGTYCDSRVPPAKMMTTGNILYALFSSDDRNNGNGFIVNFAQIDGKFIFIIEPRHEISNNLAF